MRRGSAVVLALASALALALCAGCATQTRVRSNALEFLYPTSAPATAPGDVRLTLPVRVGLAFAPAQAATGAGLSEDRRRTLLGRIADAFRANPAIAAVEVLPSSQIEPGGGFAAVDRLRQAYGIDLLALVSYDQLQFSESGKRSIAYWTLVGAYLVRGERHETHTVLDAFVYDIPSRTLLFSATGASDDVRRTTPVGEERKRRGERERGFETAADTLIEDLGLALGRFREQAASGTVRGPGTPAIEVVGGAGGALGAAELLAAALLLAWSARR